MAKNGPLHRGAYLFVLYCPTTILKINVGDGLQSIILAARDLLVKMLITHELHGIF